MNRKSNKFSNNRIPMKASTRHILSGVLGMIGGSLLIWAALFESIFVEDNGKYIAIFGGLIVVGVGIFNLIEGIKKRKDG